MCNTKVGLGGVDCQEVCAQGQMILSITILGGVVAFTLAGVCAYVCCQYQMKLKRKRGISLKILTCLILTGIGFFCFGLESIVALCNTVGFGSFSTVTKASNGALVRRSPQGLDVTSFVLYGCAACFGTCSLLVLPLAWVSLNLESGLI